MDAFELSLTMKITIVVILLIIVITTYVFLITNNKKEKCKTELDKLINDINESDSHEITL
jgi:uncharacterized membrane protein YvbJ